MNYELEIVDKQARYRGFLTVNSYRLRHELFAGGWSPIIERECLDRGHAVAVLPYDPRRDEVVLVEQIRIGALAMAGGPWLLEIVAGMIGANESKPEVVRREALEEAGCELLDLAPICEYLTSAGGSSETIALYCGRVDAARIGGIHGLAEEHEDIRVHVLSRTKAFDLLREGHIVSAAPIIALQWLELNHDQLAERWQ